MKRAFILLSMMMLAFTACGKHEDVFFDTPFVSVTDEGGSSSKMNIDKDANNLLTSLDVRLCVSNTYFQNDITIEYEMIVGDGLQEGVDFKVQPSTKSPLVFEPGIYDMPIRIIWYRNANFDPEKDNTLTIKLVESNIPEMVFGYPGPDALKSTFTFYKK